MALLMFVIVYKLQFAEYCGFHKIEASWSSEALNFIFITSCLKAFLLPTLKCQKRGVQINREVGKNSDI